MYESFKFYSVCQNLIMVDSDKEHAFTYHPEFLSFSQEIKDTLSDIFLEGLIELSEVDEIDGVTLIRYNGKQPLIFSMNKDYYEYLETMGETIASLEPVTYFKDLSRNFEYRGDGHIDLEDFDLFLAKLDEDLLMGVLSSNTGAILFQVAQKFADQIYDVIHPPEEKEAESTSDGSNDASSSFRNSAKDNSDTKGPKIPSKSELKLDLRSRLDKLKD